MIKKILVVVALAVALPFAVQPFRRGFVQGFREEWDKRHKIG